MDFRRIRQVCEYGWKDAVILSQEERIRKVRWSIFFDILYCFFKYNVWSNQYKKERLYLLSGEQKKEICLKCQKKNNYRDKWVKEFFDNYKFLHKWSSFKYETSASSQAKRRSAYKKQYGLGDNCFIGYDVIFHKHHYVDAKIVTGADCLIAEHTDIDYTGNLILGTQVAISEGAKILTHNHDIYGSALGDDKRKTLITPLKIGDYAWIGARAFILPGVNEIGRCSLIGAGSVVKNSVPPYAMVIGNPAKIVGFVYTPEEVIAFEENKYNPVDRTDIEKYEKIYNKYFINRITDIKKFVSI